MSQTTAKKSTSDNQDTSKSNIEEDVKSEKVEVWKYLLNSKIKLQILRFAIIDKWFVKNA